MQSQEASEKKIRNYTESKNEKTVKVQYSVTLERETHNCFKVDNVGIIRTETCSNLLLPKKPHLKISPKKSCLLTGNHVFD